MGRTGFYEKGKLKHPYTDKGVELFGKLNAIGRTNAWLADQLGITAVHLSNVMRGLSPWPEGFDERVDEVIDREVNHEF